MYSLIVKCWHDSQSNDLRLQIIRTDTAEEVHLDSGSFLLRLLGGDSGQAERCYIRHINSGREIYVQSGPGLRAFIYSCLLTNTPSL